MRNALRASFVPVTAIGVVTVRASAVCIGSAWIPSGVGGGFSTKSNQALVSVSSTELICVAPVVMNSSLPVR
jgi:hypothetical protein